MWVGLEHPTRRRCWETLVCRDLASSPQGTVNRSWNKQTFASGVLHGRESYVR
jgi:hypothetical protein